MVCMIPVLTPEITIHSDRVVTTSLAVSNYFHKRHDDVLRKTRSIMEECDPAYRLRNFAETSYLRENPNGGPGISTPMYELTRDAFVLIVMGFTGKKALQWKIDYITAFNNMEAKLQKSPTSTSPVAPEPIRYTLITHYVNDLPTSKRKLKPGEHIATLGEFNEIVERAGHVVIHYETLRTLTCPDIALLADKAEKHCLMWKNKMVSLG